MLRRMYRACNKNTKDLFQKCLQDERERERERERKSPGPRTPRFRTPSQRVSNVQWKRLGQIQAAVSTCQFLLPGTLLYIHTYIHTYIPQDPMHCVLILITYSLSHRLTYTHSLSPSLSLSLSLSLSASALNKLSSSSSSSSSPSLVLSLSPRP